LIIIQNTLYVLDENGDPHSEKSDASPSKRWRDVNDNSLARIPLSPRKDVGDMNNSGRSPFKLKAPLSLTTRPFSPQAIMKDNGEY
jgi:hypothetical protein